MVSRRCGMLACLALLLGASLAHADDMPGVVLELGFTPAPRSQIAVWLEDEHGTFLRTLQLTEAVAFHGVGNRPGASQMNSGYRWPYGRREGILPIWASRRAAGPSSVQWKRVIFQNRTSEGLASRTSADQSPDPYFCLSFNQSTTTRQALDAVSCASAFSSDKGRFLAPADVAAHYHEPYEDNVTHVGMDMPLPLYSLYPPRMDVTRCANNMNCFDHADVSSFAAHARAAMPEIDAVTLATPPGNTKQSLLFSLPPDWPKGKYVLWVEVNVEGDYNDAYSDKTYATPKQPTGEWDSWAMMYGYPYRGQPSTAFQLPFELGDVGEMDTSASTPVGCSSWDFWSAGYGKLEPMTNITDDPNTDPGSGADRFKIDSKGDRVSLHVRTLMPLADAGSPIPAVVGTTPPSSTMGAAAPDAGTPIVTLSDAGIAADAGTAPGIATTEPQPGDTTSTGAPWNMTRDPVTGAVILEPPDAPENPVGAIRDFRVGPDSHKLHAHEWIAISFTVPSSVEPLHAYEVRVSSGDPIVDEASFIRNGRPAKTASEDPEGAVSLMLPVDVPVGQPVASEIGDLTALTHYYVAIRATDDLNRHGPISVAQISTPKRIFATVTPCFVATAAFGSPLASEVGVLRRVRDRHLMNNTFGRAFVHAYYAHGARLASELRAHEGLRKLARALLEPVVKLAEQLEAAE